MVIPVPLQEHPVRVVIVDADDRVRESLAGILAATDRVDVLGTAGDPAAALSLVIATRPDVIMVDPRLPDLDAAAAFICAIRAELPEVCVLAMSWSDPMEQAALAAGADGFFRKTYRSSALLAALVASGT